MTVKMFTFNYQIENVTYGGQIPARSIAEAQMLLPFAEVDGELIEEIPFEYDEKLLFIAPSNHCVH